jgi:3D-(3,5/4)-trihydroxycyclohexane-1,2-dione acylhydrolase (decyclizing)
LDLAADAPSLGAWATRVKTRQDLVNALSAARGIDRTSVVVIETDINERVPGFESWWDVPNRRDIEIRVGSNSAGCLRESKTQRAVFLSAAKRNKVPKASAANRAERKRA